MGLDKHCRRNLQFCDHSEFPEIRTGDLMTNLASYLDTNQTSFPVLLDTWLLLTATNPSVEQNITQLGGLLDTAGRALLEGLLDAMSLDGTVQAYSKNDGSVYTKGATLTLIAKEAPYVDWTGWPFYVAP